MLSFAVNYNSAGLLWVLPRGAGYQHPLGLPTPGWTVAASAGLRARLGTQRKGG